MLGSKQITVTMVLTLALAGSALAQRGTVWGGRGEAWGFRGVGLGNWVLHESGVDSIAAQYQLTDEQRASYEELASKFRSDNAEVVQRWEQMRAEIQALYTEDQMPTRDAIQRIGEKYNHPSQELRPALYQLQLESAAILTPAQRQSFRRGAYARVGRGAGTMGMRGGRMAVGPRRPQMGRRAPAYWGPGGGRNFNRRPGWRPEEN